jgi:hypothetical protein
MDPESSHTAETSDQYPEALGSGLVGCSASNFADFALFFRQFQKQNLHSAFLETKYPPRPFPIRVIIGTTQGQVVVLIGGYRQVGWGKKLMPGHIL